MSDSTPLLRHPLEAPSAFRPADLMQAVRDARGLPDEPVPPICVLDFDGDLSDGLVRDGAVTPVHSWACFHTQMLGLTIGAVRCGVVPRTIGGPYAVLIAEQLYAAGARVILGLTSAGRVSPDLPLPCIVIAEHAVRDEGTSLHYLPAGSTVTTPTPGLLDHLVTALAGLAPIRRGRVWTTDAPYRETGEQLRGWAEEGVLAVEMQAASLFAFGHARGARIGIVALVSNSTDHTGEQFDTGEHAYRVQVFSAAVQAAHSFINDPSSGGDGAPASQTGHRGA
jgi:uridine phosphorylase